MVAEIVRISEIELRSVDNIVILGDSKQSTSAAFKYAQTARCACSSEPTAPLHTAVVGNEGITAYRM
jgi:hypothetical protein